MRSLPHADMHHSWQVALYALGCLFAPRLCDFIDQAVIGRSPLNPEETP